MRAQARMLEPSISRTTDNAIAVDLAIYIYVAVAYIIYTILYIAISHERSLGDPPT